MSIFDNAKNMASNAAAEGISDAALDKAAELAKSKVGEQHADKIKTVRDAVDKKIGNQ